MKRNKNKTNEKGFTLAELLIVVAIIAVLAIVAIPIFSSRLENAREETDIANLRSAKAAAVAMYLSNEDLEGNTLTSTGTTVYFDAVSGNLVSAAPTGYGKGTATDGGCEDFNLVVNPDTTHAQASYSATTDVVDKYIEIFINDTGVIAMSWAG